MYECLDNAAIKWITQRRDYVNRGNVLGLQLFGEYPCRSPMEQREGPCFGEHCKEIPVLGKELSVGR